MYVLTSMTFEQMASFIKQKKIALDNAGLFVHPSAEEVNSYFDTLMGNKGFVLGITGIQLDKDAMAMFRELVKNHEDAVVLEVDLSGEEAQLFSINGLDKVAEAIYYGMAPADTLRCLNEAHIPDEVATRTKRPAIACVPLLTTGCRIKVAAMDPEVNFEVNAENLTVVRICNEEEKV